MMIWLKTLFIKLASIIVASILFIIIPFGLLIASEVEKSLSENQLAAFGLMAALVLAYFGKKFAHTLEMKWRSQPEEHGAPPSQVQLLEKSSSVNVITFSLAHVIILFAFYVLAITAYYDFNFEIAFNTLNTHREASIPALFIFLGLPFSLSYELKERTRFWSKYFGSEKPTPLFSHFFFFINLIIATVVSAFLFALLVSGWMIFIGIFPEGSVPKIIILSLPLLFLMLIFSLIPKTAIDNFESFYPKLSLKS